MGNLVRQARRRILGNQLFTQGANAGTAALVAFILLLLFGTQVLSWQVALADSRGGRRIRPVPREAADAVALTHVAQLMDHRLGLADNLSTALFFSEVDPGAPAAPEIRRAQFERASAPRRSPWMCAVPCPTRCRARSM